MGKIVGQMDKVVEINKMGKVGKNVGNMSKMAEMGKVFREGNLVPTS